MATFTKFQDFIEAVGKGEHNLDTDTFKVYLSNAAPSAADHDDKEDIADISAEHGYTGPVDIQNAYSESSGTGTMTAVDVTITASEGTIGPFRYAIIYNDDHTTDGLMGYADYGSAITLQDGESFKIDFGASLATFS